jgi:hypothetical protein
VLILVVAQLEFVVHLNSNLEGRGVRLTLRRVKPS